MANPVQSNAEPLNPDGKSLYNPPTNVKSSAYLHERIRREFPELRIYKFWEKPIGPHPSAMFEVNTFTPHQTGAFFSWLTVHRGPCSYVISIPSHTRVTTRIYAWIS
ncbi:hypothetical protein J132_06477 [Termitomyces sp. J132]|nr:hypothetical protein J132_06477 [Termitomyces sp. J132]